MPLLSALMAPPHRRHANNKRAGFYPGSYSVLSRMTAAKRFVTNMGSITTWDEYRGAMSQYALRMRSISFLISLAPICALPT